MILFHLDWNRSSVVVVLHLNLSNSDAVSKNLYQLGEKTNLKFSVLAINPLVNDTKCTKDLVSGLFFRLS